MPLKKMILFGLCCLLLPACAADYPVVPYPSSQEVANAYYGEYPENYQRIISQYPRFMQGRFKTMIDYGQGPTKTMAEWMGKYEYGWGGYLDAWLTDYRGWLLEKASYQYLIRDNKLVFMKKFGFPLPMD